MLARNDYATTWQYLNDVPIGATFFFDVGAEHSGYECLGGLVPAGEFMAPIMYMPKFSIDVRTDDAIEIDIQTGMTEATMSTMVTLVCAVGLQHNTIYNLAPPFNTEGYIILTGNFVRLQLRNITGNIVTPFELQARVWH